jgi:hypothetical protein
LSVMFSGWWPRLTVIWPKSTQLTCSLGLITPVENLGRHSLPPLNRISSRDSTTRLKQLLSTRQGLQRWKIYSLTFVDSENSDGAKDTWCSPHCLNAVHEEAGDGYVHGKLKEDKLHWRCRGTSLQASNGGARTSPRTEPGSAMQARVLLSVFFRASSGDCRQRRRNSLLGVWVKQRQRWASGGLAKN